ncbi:MAG: hypothetical protein JW755_06095, partial [Candidatus Aminicenantes bacterium]|nr:hypothetical protein [Candidatus Aminicenantes bacterium]
MQNPIRSLYLMILMSIFSLTTIYSQDLSVEGKWILVPQASTEIDLYSTLKIEIKRKDDELVLMRIFGGRRAFSETLNLKSGGSDNVVFVNDRVFPTNVFMGLSMPVGGERIIKAFWNDPAAHLKLEETYDVFASQGKSQVFCEHDFTAGPHPDLMTYTVKRSSRERPLIYQLKREGSREAYVMYPEDNWTMGEGLEKQVFLISLQGNANRKSPQLYFVYPESWDFTYTPYVFDYYKDRKFYNFRRLFTLEQA